MLMGCATLSAQEVNPVTPKEVRLDDDVQVRARAILDIPLARNLSLDWSEQVRMHNNVSDVDKIVSSVGISYKALPWLKVGASYGFVNTRDEETDGLGNTTVEWKIRHQANVDITGSYKLGRVKLSLRERVRFAFRGDSVSSYEHADPFITLRSRFKAAYDIRQCRWEPYAAVELYTTLNARGAVPNYLNYNVAYKQYINRLRFTLGTEFKINNYHRLDIYYHFHMNQSYEARYKANKGDLKRWDHEKQNCHVIGIDYKFKL